MLCIDMSRHTIVRVGLSWPHHKLPSTKEMLSRLERNEAFVSWLQPRDGLIEDQFPAMRIGDAFYTLSLRMMKAVWRHVRLRRGFVNREGAVLRIPAVLLSEKMRTQERFQVRGCCVVLVTTIRMTSASQVMRSKASHAQAKAAQPIRNMLWVVQNVVITMPSPGPMTVFKVSEEDIFQNLLYQMRRDCPSIMGDQRLLLTALGGGASETGAGPSAPVPPESAQPQGCC